MNITEITDDNMSLCKCTNKDDDIMTIEISYLFLILASVPCFLSIICCLSFSICSFIKFFLKVNKI